MLTSSKMTSPISALLNAKAKSVSQCQEYWGQLMLWKSLLLKSTFHLSLWQCEDIGRTFCQPCALFPTH